MLAWPMQVCEKTQRPRETGSDPTGPARPLSPGHAAPARTCSFPAPSVDMTSVLLSQAGRSLVSFQAKVPNFDLCPQFCVRTTHIETCSPLELCYTDKEASEVRGSPCPLFSTKLPFEVMSSGRCDGHFGSHMLDAHALSLLSCHSDPNSAMHQAPMPDEGRL